MAISYSEMQTVPAPAGATGPCRYPWCESAVGHGQKFCAAHPGGRDREIRFARPWAGKPVIGTRKVDGPMHRSTTSVRLPEVTEALLALCRA